MTSAQEATLRKLCGQYSVTYDPAHYRPTFDLPDGWVAGWIGGPSQHGRKTIYVGVAPNGEASS